LKEGPVISFDSKRFFANVDVPDLGAPIKNRFALFIVLF